MASIEKGNFSYSLIRPFKSAITEFRCG